MSFGLGTVTNDPIASLGSRGLWEALSVTDVNLYLRLGLAGAAARARRHPLASVLHISVEAPWVAGALKSIANLRARISAVTGKGAAGATEPASLLDGAAPLIIADYLPRRLRLCRSGISHCAVSLLPLRL